MEHKLSKILKKPLFWQIYTILLIFWLFFPKRHVFLNDFAYITGQYSDFTSFSLYIVDLVLILGFFFIFWIKSGGLKAFLNLKWLFLWLIVIILPHITNNLTYNSYFFARIIASFVAYGTIVMIFGEYDLKSLFMKTFLAFSTIQSLLALFQFLKQSYLGLGYLGEQQLSPWVAGFAKIITDSLYIRGYGTFPHPNPLSAFLVVGILIACYLIIASPNSKQRVFWGILLFLNTLGLVTTFSRAAFLALIIAGTAFFVGQRCTKKFSKQSALSLIILIVSIGVSVSLFRSFLFSRITVTDTATEERIIYTKIGISMIKESPTFGVGIGESVLHMKQYSTTPLKPSQIQPIHNYFLLAASELGIIGALLLLWFFLSHLKSLAYNLTTCNLLLGSILLSFFILMQFDHYFYTLEQTQLLLWIILGIIAAQTKTPSHSEGVC